MIKKIGTHDKRFHTDEVFAVATLLMVFPDAQLVRTRDETVLATCDILVDVGREYDHDRGRYDHHQPGGAGRRQNGIELSSFGLVWRHYGHLLENSEAARNIVDAMLVQSIDARDNGQQLSQANPAFNGAMPFEISALINLFNPIWDEAKNYDRAFESALIIAIRVLELTIAHASSVVRAKEFVRRAIQERTDPRILIIDPGCPWQDIVLKEAPDAIFALLRDDGDWTVQCIPRAQRSKEYRKSLPEVWSGMDGATFAAHTGVADATFVHRGLFICGARSREGALALARLAIAG